MTDKCFDIGAMQAFLDGELAAEITEAVARHVSACDECARLLAESEEESALAFSLLEQEFNTLVPTQRLWTKINNSIEREKKSFWRPIFARLLQPQMAAFASLIFVAVVSITLLSLKPNAPVNNVARTIEKNQSVAPIVAENENQPIVAPTDLPQPNERVSAKPGIGKSEFRTVKTSYSRNEKNAPETKVSSVSFGNQTPIANSAISENVLGEESYLKTIATLNTTVENRKDEVLSPSARFAFERDLAVTSDAINRMRKEVRKNPNNEAAKQILRASYQNKIDLLNSVADKTELMASLK